MRNMKSASLLLLIAIFLSCVPKTGTVFCAKYGGPNGTPAVCDISKEQCIITLPRPDPVRKDGDGTLSTGRCEPYTTDRDSMEACRVNRDTGLKVCFRGQ
jgi:hypothetical protein